MSGILLLPFPCPSNPVSVDEQAKITKVVAVKAAIGPVVVSVAVGVPGQVVAVVVSPIEIAVVSLWV